MGMELAADRKALVTGGASGFGKEIAKRLHAAGAAVAVVDIDEARARETARELGEAALGIAADVRSPARMQAAVDQVLAAFGGLDTLVVSAGVFHMAPLEQISEEAWDRTLDINLKGAFVTLQAAAPALRASGRGRVVTIASDAGRRGFPTQSVYVASKFGLVGFSESMAAELAPDGVTVNCVCPVGCPTTSMGQEVLRVKVEREGRSADSIAAAAARGNPLGRNATEADVADAVLFLISEHASFLTGLALDVDGGAKLGAVPGVE
jgi:NAD(P)-dependent dehydrogenase (short-subunit alcohol dehydrogenase family)